MTPLQERELVIMRSLASYVASGNALREIHDLKLWADAAPSFGAYLRERWGWSRSRAYQLIDAAKIAELAIARGEMPPRTEGAARARVGELRPFRDTRGRKPEPKDEPEDLTPAQIAAGLFRLYSADVLLVVADLIQKRLGAVTGRALST